MDDHLSSVRVKYRDNRYLTCQAIRSSEDYTPFNFLEYFDREQALEALYDCARFVTSKTLEYRSKPIKGAVELTQPERVFGFLSGELGMEPVGRLVLVDDEETDAWGVTRATERVAYVHPSRVLRDGHHENLIGIPDQLLIESVAVHEAVHLAGMPDWSFFWLQEDHRHVANIDLAPLPNLRPYEANSSASPTRRGWYLEEGFASLIQAAYLWKHHAELATNTATIACAPPDGAITIALPLRHDYRGSYQTMFSWGIERLVALCPPVWDVLLDSRKYDRRWSAVRSNVKRIVDSASPGLFEQIDQTDRTDLGSMIETTDRIDRAARRSGA